LAQENRADEPKGLKMTARENNTLEDFPATIFFFGFVDLP
jgi:hypothetical protein